MRMRLVLAIGLLLTTFATTSTSASEVEPPRAFSTVEIYLDIADRSLAAYQLTLETSRDDTRLVGVEGGAAPFTEPPRYDPRALRGGRIKLAALCLDDSLRTGRVHVATLHLEHAAERIPRLDISEVVAVDGDGNPTAAESSQEIGD